MRFVAVARSEDLEVGMMAVHDVEGRPVVLARTEDGIHALHGICPHAGFRFVDAALADGTEVECPMHGARFEAATGDVLCGPSKDPLGLLECRVVDGEIQVAVA